MKLLPKGYLLFLAFAFMPYYGYSQYTSADWMNDKPFKDLTKDLNTNNSGIKTNVKKAIKSDKPTAKEREEERQYNNRLNELMDNQSELLRYMDYDDYSSIIMSNSVLREKLKETIWNNINNILNLTKNPDIKQIVMDDPMLKQYYDLEVKKQDMRVHPEKIPEYLKNPQLKEIIKTDPELAQILAQQVKKQVEAEQKAEQDRLMRQKAEEERLERARQAEINRLKEEAIQAKVQEDENEQKKIRNKQLSNKLLSELSPKQKSKTSELPSVLESPNLIQYYNDFFSDPTLFQAKLNSVVYNTETELLKALHNAPTLSEYVSEKTERMQNKVKGKLISIPIKKANKVMDNVFNIGWPGANLGEKVRVSNLVREEEEGFVGKVTQCIARDAVESVFSGDAERFNNCIQQATDTFVDQLKTNIDDLTHVKVFETIRKYKRWLLITKQDNEE